MIRIMIIKQSDNIYGEIEDSVSENDLKNAVKAAGYNPVKVKIDG